MYKTLAYNNLYGYTNINASTTLPVKGNKYWTYGILTIIVRMLLLKTIPAADQISPDPTCQGTAHGHPHPWLSVYFVKMKII